MTSSRTTIQPTFRDCLFVSMLLASLGCSPDPGEQNKPRDTEGVDGGQRVGDTVGDGGEPASDGMDVVDATDTSRRDVELENGDVADTRPSDVHRDLVGDGKDGTAEAGGPEVDVLDDTGPCGVGDRSDVTCVRRECSPGYRLAPNGRCVPTSSDAPKENVADIASYTTSGAGGQLALFADSRIAAYPNVIDLSTGTIKSPWNGMGANTSRISVWIDQDSAQHVHTHKEDVKAVAPDGTTRWGAGLYGCCNYFARRVVAVDASDKAGYVAQGGLWRLDLETGGKSKVASGVGKNHVLVDGDAAFVISQKRAMKVDLDGGILRWDKEYGGENASSRGRGAVTKNGHLVASFDNGAVVRLKRSTGEDGWERPEIEPATGRGGPLAVVDEDNRAYLTTGAPGVVAVDAASGQTAWKRYFPAEAVDLLVGDENRLYVFVPPVGRVYVLDRTNGELLKVYTGLYGPSNGAPTADMLLRDGSLYTLSSGHLAVFPVASERYPQDASWPVTYHDNQRTSNRESPLSY